eukprot:SM000056S17918  [mRNA]  locus=s56:74246:78346:+ [translate_table: standard]
MAALPAPPAVTGASSRLMTVSSCETESRISTSLRTKNQISTTGLSAPIKSLPRERLEVLAPGPTPTHSARRLYIQVMKTGSSGISTEQMEKLQSLGGVVTDDAVPEGHQGLHGFLYGDNGADVHDAPTSTYQAESGQDDGSTVMLFSNYVDPRDGIKFAGVYAIYAEDGALQYIGYSRNVILTMKAHRSRVGAARCSAVRVKMYTEAAMVTRARLQEECELWLAQTAPPPGNSTDRALWEGTAGTAAAYMTEEDKAAYEEKKLKMRKAMGENLYDDVEGETEDSKTRRLRLLQAVEGDDWSSVIDGQTTEMLHEQEPTTSAQTGSSVTDAAAAVPGQIISPFARPGGPLMGSQESAAELELTVANVDMVLNDVRPYLIADGGNVEVVGVEDGIVALRLQGACGTCPSSTSTMKMGIERALQAKFQSSLREVVQVDKIDLGATVESLDAFLEGLRPAITNYGGSVEVVSVDRVKGACLIDFKGPAPISMGIQAAVRDKFPDMRTVNLVSP